MQAKKIIIGSGSFIFRQGVISLLNNLFTGLLISEAGNFEQLLSKIKTTLKGTLIVDDGIFGEHDVFEFSDVLQDYPGIEVLIISRDEVSSEIQNLDVELLSIDADQQLFEKQFREGFKLDQNGFEEQNALSEREIDILKKVALGLTNKEISDALYISPHTVITHRKNITAKLGIKTISGLTVYAMLNNLLGPEDLDQTKK
ncbi:MAG: response regulator transcription factor [Bacteroidota bacterium]